MYHCGNCHSTFEQLATDCESFGERFFCCPECGSDDWDEGRLCECGGFIPISECQELCEECRIRVVKQFRRMLDDEFDPAAQRYLEDYLEGKAWSCA